MLMWVVRIDKHTLFSRVNFKQTKSTVINVLHLWKKQWSFSSCLNTLCCFYVINCEISPFKLQTHAQTESSTIAPYFCLAFFFFLHEIANATAVSVTMVSVKYSTVQCSVTYSSTQTTKQKTHNWWLIAAPPMMKLNNKYTARNLYTMVMKLVGKCTTLTDYPSTVERLPQPNRSMHSFIQT